jgi:hypothetical protein
MNRYRSPSKCPVCTSAVVVEGRILADGSEDGSAESFFPRGLRLLTLNRTVRLVGREVFRACTECGHVWNTLDASGLRELIEKSGTPELEARLDLRRKRKGDAV